MAKLFTVNEEYNGAIGETQFTNGVAVTDKPSVIQRIKNTGGVVVEGEDSLNTIDTFTKQTLVSLAADMGLDSSDKTKYELICSINAFIENAKNN